jgi:pyrroloquinoline quinone (PQQ) biosynthesis protein C
MHNERHDNTNPLVVANITTTTMLLYVINYYYFTLIDIASTPHN